MTHPVSWQSEYTFDSQFLKLSGHRYHYVDEGEGRPVVMVHGNPTWSFYWRHLVTALRSDYRAIAVDHLGCGLSDKPTTATFRLADHARHLGQLLEQLDLDGVTLVVHDWGGPIGLTAALEYPERISRLVILNTGAFPPPFIPLRIRLCRIPLLGSLMVRGPNLFARLALRMAMNRTKLSTVARAGLLAPYDSWRHRRAIDLFVKDIPTSSRHPNWAPLVRLEKELPHLDDLPVRILWGMKDWCFTPSCLDQMCQLLPSAEVTRLVDVGHYVMEDAPDEVIQLVRQFLEETESVSQGVVK